MVKYCHKIINIKNGGGSMGDLLYFNRAMKDCLVQPEDAELLENIKQLTVTITGLISDIRLRIGAAAPFPELCKNVAYYLHYCLSQGDLKEKLPSWVCELSQEVYDKLDVIRQLAQNPQIWDLVYEIHGGYLGRMMEESALVQFSLQKYRTPIKEASEYSKIVGQLRVARPPLF